MEKQAIEKFLLPKFTIKAIIILEAGHLPKVEATYYPDQSTVLHTKTISYRIEDGMMADVQVLSEIPQG